MQRSLGSDDLGRTIMVFMQAIEFLEPERPSISDHLPAVTLDELVHVWWRPRIDEIRLQDPVPCGRKGSPDQAV